MKKMKITIFYMLFIASIFCLTGCEPAAGPLPAEPARSSAAGQPAAGLSDFSAAAVSRASASQASSKGPAPTQPPEKSKFEELCEAYPEIRALELEKLGSNFHFYEVHQYREETLEAAAYECIYDEFITVLIVYEDFVYLLEPSQLLEDVGVNGAFFHETDLDRDGKEELICVLDFGEDFACQSLYVFVPSKNRCTSLRWQDYRDTIPAYAAESLQDGVLTVRTQTNSASFPIYAGITNQDHMVMEYDGDFCFDEQTGALRFRYFVAGYCGLYFWHQYDHDGYYIYGEIHIPVEYDGTSFHWGQSELLVYDEVHHTPAIQRRG